MLDGPKPEPLIPTTSILSMKHNHPQIEQYPDQYWMNSIERVVVSCPNSEKKIALLRGVNYHWLSMINGLWKTELKLGYNSFDPMI